MNKSNTCMNILKGIMALTLAGSLAACSSKKDSKTENENNTTGNSEVENNDQKEEVTGLEIIDEAIVDSDGNITVIDGEEGTSEVTGSESSTGGQTPASGGNGQSGEAGGQNEGSGTSQSGDSGNAGSEGDGFDIPIEEGEGTGGF